MGKGGKEREGERERGNLVSTCMLEYFLHLKSRSGFRAGHRCGCRTRSAVHNVEHGSSKRKHGKGTYGVPSAESRAGACVSARWPVVGASPRSMCAAGQRCPEPSFGSHKVGGSTKRRERKNNHVRKNAFKPNACIVITRIFGAQHSVKYLPPPNGLTDSQVN